MSAVLETTISRATNGNGVEPRLITAAEYNRMIEAGIYTENDRIELLNGEIIQIMAKGKKHASANDRIARFFYRIFDEKVFVRNQNPIALDDLSEPEPDIVLARRDAQEYAGNHPTPADILLVMEISDTTLAYERDDKWRAYSRNGIRQYLLLNLQNETVEDYRQPEADGYGAKQTHRRGAAFNLVEFPEIEVRVDDLF